MENKNYFEENKNKDPSAENTSVPDEATDGVPLEEAQPPLSRAEQHAVSLNTLQTDIEACNSSQEQTDHLLSVVSDFPRNTKAYYETLMAITQVLPGMIQQADKTLASYEHLNVALKLARSAVGYLEPYANEIEEEEAQEPQNTKRLAQLATPPEGTKVKYDRAIKRFQKANKALRINAGDVFESVEDVTQTTKEKVQQVINPEDFFPPEHDSAQDFYENWQDPTGPKSSK